MSYATKEQYDYAVHIDLADWLLRHYPSQVELKYGSVLLLANEHIAVKYNAGYSGYINFRTGKTGNSVDYLMNFLGYDYPSAVIALCEGEAAPQLPAYSRPVPVITQSDAPTLLPDAADSYKNVFAFLTKTRHIPADVVTEMMHRRILYQDKNRNCIFINPQKNYYEVRGTNTYADARCKKRESCPEFCSGCHSWCTHMETCPNYQKDPFHGKGKNVAKHKFWYYLNSSEPVVNIYVCEAAIDAVSLYVIQRNNGITTPSAYISIGGVNNTGTINDLLCNYTKKNILIATDTDDPGNAVREKFNTLSSISPVTHDWNDDLKKGVYYGSTN